MSVLLSRKTTAVHPDDQRTSVADALDPASTLETISVAVVAETQIAARRLSALLGRAGYGIAAAVDGAELLPRPAPDVVVLALPRDECLTALAGLGDGDDASAVVVVLEENQARNARAYLDAGAEGIVVAARVEETLAATIAAVHVGQRVLPAPGRTTARPTLSVREKQTLALVVLGLSNTEIGAKLHLTVSTVKSHLRSAFRKLGVRTRYEATALILDPDSGLGLGILTISDERGAR